ncbi:SCO7613 C-terminal domain-containing membrane protein [Nocardioides sp. MH1]|uniref:SCO7613 C-terminal domain-containing membrane protein n=1 Tax=Nocardioides sp. MH1 TaxID=3242490 RepID=UPI003522A8F7
MRYADPFLCPDCRSPLPRGAASCPTCSLPVRHPLAVELFATLKHADVLVGQLRATVAEPLPTPPVNAPAAPAPAAPVIGGVLPPPPPPSRPATAPAPVPMPVPVRSGIGMAAVPKILLGLGALCLLVAAIVFLAVSWSVLGVGGRTAVLLTLTAATAGSSVLLNRFRLRVAGESMSVVALGLLGLDVLGAHAAGWFGDSSSGWAVAATGLVVALGGTAMALPRFDDGPRLVAPQVFVGIGYLLGWTGLVAATGHGLVVGNGLVVVGAGVTWLSRRALPVRAWSVGIATATVWGATVLLAIGTGLTDLTVRGTWVEGAGWSLLVSAATALAPGLVTRRRDLLVAGGSLGALLVTIAAVLPSTDESAAVGGGVALAVTAAWVVAYATLPAAVRAVALAPAVVGSSILVALDATAGVVALLRIASLDSSSPFDVVLHRPDALTEPLLTVPSALVPLALLALVVAQGRPGRGWWDTGLLVTGLAAAVTLASYDVALVSVIVTLDLVAVAALVVALTAPGTRHTVLGVAALVVGWVSVVLALFSTPVVVVAAVTVTGLAVVLHLVGRSAQLRALGAVALSPALAVLVWSAGSAAGVDAALLGGPLLLLLGVLAVARPRLEIELPAAAVALVAVPPAIFAADDPDGSLALHLVVLGVVLSASALLHESRRALVWAALPVFTLASWVWFGDQDVSAPEPYLLPLAVALTVIGLVHLRRHPDAGTELALLPGLLLGTLPSLLLVLGDPLSTRALVLGAACLVLTVVGAALRWSAPLLVGSAVGALVVLRELGPYAGEVPQWVWIGLAGALLTTVGITWERRLLEVRQAVGQLGRLR